MPTVLRSGPYRVLFYSREPAGEPPHVHVKRVSSEAKVWLEPVALGWNEGFPARELGPILSLVRDHRSALPGSSAPYCRSCEIIVQPCWRPTIATTARPDLGDTHIRGVRLDADSVQLDLMDGRSVSAPLAWFPRLFDATPEQRLNFKIGGYGVHWPDVDEDISARSLLQGRHDPERATRQAAWRSPLLDPIA